MAELTFKSPGVSTREIDLSGPTALQPRGIPAGVVGTARRGPAFVPITFATFQDFVATFGNTDGEKFGPLAINEWMRHAGAGTYVRVLGIGNGKARSTSGGNPGNVTNAGFVVGAELPQANGIVAANDKAVAGGPLGSAYFLGCFMSESAGSTVFSEAGIQGARATGGHKPEPILRAVLLAPDDVVLSLSMSHSTVTNNTPVRNRAAATSFGASTNSGAPVGSVITGSSKQEFVMLLNGHKISDSYGNVITASFDPKSPSYIRNVFNTDPTAIRDAGHYLYAAWDIDPVLAVITQSFGLTPVGRAGGDKVHVAFLLTGSAGRNNGIAANATNAGVPNFENFEDRYSPSFSPFVTSQKFGGSSKNLFRLHALDDGAVGSKTFKITVENVQASTNENNKFGTFDLLIRRFDDSDAAPVVVGVKN